MERYKEIERSIIKKYRKEIWSKFIKAIKDYELIKENDKVMVCISGGKDSFLLAKCIQELERHGKVPFTAEYVVMNPGYNEKHSNNILENAKVLNIPIEEVTKEQRSSAKAVNFGIVYGISDFGLSEQLGISKKEAKNYIEQYLEKYNGIDKFMKDIVEQAKKDGYVETLFNRRRYIPELSSNNYMVRQFGARAAMNTPIQGTAADIMKIAMVNLYKELKNQKLDAKIVLQIHDELMIECKEEECKKVEEILKQCMENAIKLSVPLEVEVSCAHNWYDLK